MESCSLNCNSSVIDGFSLLELVCAIALSLLLMVGIAHVYTAAMVIYVRQQQLSAVQENMRFSAHILNLNVRSACYAGPVGLRNLALHDPSVGFNENNCIRGYASSVVPTYLFDRVLPNTDVIVVQAVTAQVSRFIEVAYFISDTGRLDDAGQHIYALYEVKNRGNKQELIEGISSMRVSYGIRDESSAVAVQYYDAANITARSLWHKVCIVAIMLDQNLGVKELARWCIYINLRNRLPAISHG